MARIKKRTRQASDDLACLFLRRLATNEAFSDQASPAFFHEQETPITSGKRSSVEIAVRADLAAVAILTARSIATVPGLHRKLIQESPVITIATQTVEMNGWLLEILRRCVFTNSVRLVRSEAFATIAPQREAVAFIRNGEGKDHRPQDGNEIVAAALHAQNAIIGLSPSPSRYLPRDLMLAADHHLSLPSLNASLVNLVIEVVTGNSSALEIPATNLNGVNISDFPLAIRKGSTPEECLMRLAEIVRRKRRPDDAGPTLEELPGYGEAKVWGLNLSADLISFRHGLLNWDEIDKGALIEGPPGVGKTQYAKALARSAQVSIVTTSVADWNAQEYLSGTLRAIRDVFSQAKKLTPAILFIDELDGISDRSTLRGEYVEYWSQIINLLLELLAGAEDRQGVVVIGATNFADKIDPAIRRAGRLDRTIKIGLPSIDDLYEILQFYLRDSIPELDLRPLCLAAYGSTGADIEAYVRRARSSARRANRALLASDILREVTGGSSELPTKLRKPVSIHEAGHIIVGTVLGNYTPDAVWLTQSGGLTHGEFVNDHDYTLASLEKNVSTLLAGRAAEEELLGTKNITIGAGVGEHSDLARATSLVCDIEHRFGLGHSGLLQFPTNAPAAAFADPRSVEAMRQRLKRCYVRAREIVTRHRIAMIAIATAIERKGYLVRDDIMTLLAEHNVGLSTADDT